MQRTLVPTRCNWIPEQAYCWTEPLRDLELAALYTSIAVYFAIL